MKTKLVLTLFGTALLLFSCNTKNIKPLTSHKAMKNKIEMLYGKIDLAQLYFDYPDWKRVMQTYKADQTIIKKLRTIKKPFQVKLFLATWCPDSKREAPHFFKIMQQSGLDKEMTVTMWAVDRHLKLDNDFQKQYDLKRVPTFIFYRMGKEIGRIVESPQAFLLEEDVLNILSK